ncbi:hypothetical protein GR138_18510 [Shinella kummerowiae]|jgi:hypothetical protein|uniref:Uncharacterized protein n=1 Tax=Shinella kummerowiae TaxID=417745 RepID=A0A6N8SF39_9HYPH|nr:hypothetical protein [Shinella kummerowiae]MXN47193.1 hypothetical protein [Shinella kummerowiae]
MHDSYVKDFFSNIAPTRKDAFGRSIGGRVIGWKRANTGQLGAICVFPHLGGKYLYTVDAQNPMRLRFLHKL